MNRKEIESLDQSMAGTMKPPSLQDVLDLQKQRAQIVDTRDPAEFAGVHLKDSINIGINGNTPVCTGGACSG